jgi:hypothetical protein
MLFVCMYVCCMYVCACMYVYTSAGTAAAPVVSALLLSSAAHSASAPLLCMCIEYIGVVSMYIQYNCVYYCDENGIKRQ